MSAAHRLLLSALAVAAALGVGCASGASSSLVRGMTAPNPSGCYVEVFDREQLRGAGDFINGPMRYASLNELANGAHWNGRIRSIEVGRGATVTLWASPNRGGKSMRLRPQARYQELPAEFSGKIESIDVGCEQELQAPGYLVTQGLN